MQREVIAKFSILSKFKSKEENQFLLVREYINTVLEKNFYEICLTKSSKAEREIITTAFSKIRNQVSKNIDSHAKK